MIKLKTRLSVSKFVKQCECFLMLLPLYIYTLDEILLGTSYTQTENERWWWWIYSTSSDKLNAYYFFKMRTGYCIRNNYEPVFVWGQRNFARATDSYFTHDVMSSYTDTYIWFVELHFPLKWKNCDQTSRLHCIIYLIDIKYLWNKK